MNVEEQVSPWDGRPGLISCFFYSSEPRLTALLFTSCVTLSLSDLTSLYFMWGWDGSTIMFVMRNKGVSASKAWWEGFLGNRRAEAEVWRLAWGACVRERTMRRKASWSGQGYSERSGAADGQGCSLRALGTSGQMRMRRRAGIPSFQMKNWNSQLGIDSEVNHCFSK